MNFSICGRCQINNHGSRNLLTSDHLKQGQWQRELISCQRFHPYFGGPACRKGSVSMLAYCMIPQLEVPALVGCCYDILLPWELDELIILNPKEQLWAVPIQFKVICDLKPCSYLWKYCLFRIWFHCVPTSQTVWKLVLRVKYVLWKFLKLRS